MSAHRIFFAVRDRLVELGLVSRPRFYMQRRPVGSARRRLVGCGRRPRMRRLPLKRLLGL